MTGARSRSAVGPRRPWRGIYILSRVEREAFEGFNRGNLALRFTLLRFLLAPVKQRTEEGQEQKQEPEQEVME